MTNTTTGIAVQDDVLSRGNMEDGTVLLTNFLGHEPGGTAVHVSRDPPTAGCIKNSLTCYAFFVPHKFSAGSSVQFSRVNEFQLQI